MRRHSKPVRCLPSAITFLIFLLLLKKKTLFLDERLAVLPSRLKLMCISKANAFETRYLENSGEKFSSVTTRVGKCFCQWPDSIFGLGGYIYFQS